MINYHSNVIIHLRHAFQKHKMMFLFHLSYEAEDAICQNVLHPTLSPSFASPGNIIYKVLIGSSGVCTSLNIIIIKYQLTASD